MKSSINFVVLTGNISLLLSRQVHNAHDLEHVMELGSKNRSVGATLMNVDSSRSHSIFSIDIEMMESGEDGREKLRAGRLNLVDLAGSERQSKTGSTGNGERERPHTIIFFLLHCTPNISFCTRRYCLCAIQ